MECIGVASGCGEQEAGVASGSGWNLWVWLLFVVVSRGVQKMFSWSCFCSPKLNIGAAPTIYHHLASYT